ncbi:MAG: NrfD/PsrC family molybdoenzyme membrane anchor subunit [Raoultibacter sp.]
MVWGAEIAWYLFLAGLGAGAFAVSAWISWKYPKAKTLPKIGRIIAPIAVGIGLVLLMVDATAGFLNPTRFFLLLSNFSSVMTWGVVILSIFMVIAMVAVVLNLLKKEVPRWLDLLGVIAALAVATYTGVLLGVSPAFPLWNLAILPILFVVSAASSGIAAVFLVGLLVCRDELQGMDVIEKVHFGLPVIELVLLVVLLFMTNSMGAQEGSVVAVAALASVANLISGSYALPFWVGLIVVGLVLPTVLQGYSLFGKKQSGDAPVAVGVPAMAIASEAAVLVGGFLLRYLIVLAAIPIC